MKTNARPGSGLHFSLWFQNKSLLINVHIKGDWLIGGLSVAVSITL